MSGRKWFTVLGLKLFLGHRLLHKIFIFGCHFDFRLLIFLCSIFAKNIDYRHAFVRTQFRFIFDSFSFSFGTEKLTFNSLLDLFFPRLIDRVKNYLAVSFENGYHEHVSVIQAFNMIPLIPNCITISRIYLVLFSFCDLK
jgi:hypothetical protein